ncbi:MAG: RsmB/NOP family class I SAM-dependent RNA methyltransferase [Bacteroidetes bacterium]|nr:RsmB/NOP family class I SAM-dependent RNA methyltransferase [Bacteroidota bacterium]
MENKAMPFPVRKAIIEGLKSVFIDGKIVEKEVPILLKANSKFGSRDRAMVANSIYEIVRYWRKYVYLSNQTEISITIEKLANVLDAFLEFRHKNIALSFEIDQSFPDWLQNIAIEELGKEKWEEQAILSNQKSKVYIRTNFLKITAKKLEAAIKELGYTALPVENMNGTFEIPEKNNLSHSKLFKDGFFEFQDISSQLVGTFCGVEEGQTVLDACAGAGGKSLQLASMMDGKIQIIASDKNENKLTILRERCQRAGVKNLSTLLQRHIFSANIKADVVLLDVPCSATGTFRRNPGLKWKLTSELLEENKVQQREILELFAPTVNENGHLVYVTCSILPSEGEKQVEWFLEKFGAEFKLIEQKRIDLSAISGDGFFMAKFERI